MRVTEPADASPRRSSARGHVHAAGTEIGKVRQLQIQREAGLLPGAGSQFLSLLVALYNLARMVDIVAEYLVSGTPVDVAIRLDRHHANVSEITELAPDPALAHLADLLHVGLRSLVDAS